MSIITILGFEISPEKYEYLVSLPKDKLVGWVEAGVAILPNFAAAILTLLLFYPFAKIAKWLAGKVVKKTSDNVAVRALFQNIVFMVVLLIGVVSALEILKLEKTVGSLLAGAGVLGLAMGFAFQEIASNFLSGILITFRKPYRIGDVVEVQGRRGTVQSIDLRTTSIVTGDGLEIIIPNKLMITETLINYTSTPERKIEMIIGVSHKDDLEKVEIVAKKAVENIPDRIKELPIEFYYQSFGQSSINFKIAFWASYPGKSNNYDKAIHQAIINIRRAFDENGIHIPYPIQTLELATEKVQLRRDSASNQTM